MLFEVGPSKTRSSGRNGAVDAIWIYGFCLHILFVFTSFMDHLWRVNKMDSIILDIDANLRIVAIHW